MKLKLFSLIVTATIVLFLTGCNQVEEWLTKASEMLDEQLASGENSEQEQPEEELAEADEEDDVAEAEGEMDEATNVDEANEANSGEDLDESKMNNGVELNNVKQSIENSNAFEARDAGGFQLNETIDFQTYNGLDPPNGLPVFFPDEWVLIYDNSDDPTAIRYDALFCINSLKDLETIMTEFGADFEYFKHGVATDASYGEDYYLAEFYRNDGFEEIFGFTSFYYDEHNNKCALMSIAFDNQFGIDPYN